MSVINQMLRDLEQRKLKPTVSNHYIDEINIVAKKTYNIWWFLLPLLIGIVIAINIYLHSLNQNYSKQDTVEKNVPVTQIETTTEMAVKLKETHKEQPPETLSNKNTDRASIQLTETVDEGVFKQQEPIKAKAIKVAASQPIVTDKTVLTSSNDAQMQIVEHQEIVLPKVIIKRKRSELSVSELVQQARFLMKDDQDKAIHLLKNNLNKITPDTDYYALLANLYQRKQNFESAITYYKKALDISPYKGDIWIGTALAYRGAGELKKSEKAFKQALKTTDISQELRLYVQQQVNGVTEETSRLR